MGIPVPSFGAWLKGARKAHDITQGELAERAGCSLKTIAKIESGERRPSKQLAELLASALSIPPEDLQGFISLARNTAGTTGQLTNSPLMDGRSKPADGALTVLAAHSTPNNLPTLLTEFVGREELIALVSATIRRPYARLITLRGPGGVGKTRLSVEIAGDLFDDFPDGVFFVDLSLINNPALLLPYVLRAIGIEESGNSALEVLLRHLRSRRVLLILDNFEQILPAGRLVTELLMACPQTRALVTSREPLRVRGEREIVVPPLTIPGGGEDASTAEIEAYESVRLFVDRAQHRLFDFVLDEENAGAIAELCCKLEGLPLSIELSAARIRELSPAQMLKQPGGKLRLLTGPLADLPSRQQTLRDTIAWSYDLLDDTSRQVLRRLAVFSGSFSLRDAGAILELDQDGGEGVIQQLERLVDKSLLLYAAGCQETDPRFNMLQTLREYALEQLERAGETDTYRRKHALYFLAMAEEAEPQLRGALQKYWFDQLEEEHDNFREALRWMLGMGDAELSLLMCGWLTMFWYYRGYNTEGRIWLTEALTGIDKVSSELGAKLFNAAGILAWAQGDLDEARKYYEKSLTVWREVGDAARAAYTIYNIAGVLLVNAQYDEVRPLLEEIGPMFREIGRKDMVSSTLNRLSIVVEHQGDVTQAAALCREALAMDEEVGDARHIALMKGRLGEIALRQEKVGEAENLFREALIVFDDLRDRENIAKTLEKFGMVSQLYGQTCRAARLLGASSALRESVNAPVTPLEHETYDVYLANTRSDLGEAAWSKAWAEGAAMKVEEAVEYALAET